MKPRSPVLLKLAELYEESSAGRHGGGKLDFQPGIEELLAAAGCGEGELRELAERDLRAAAEAGLIVLVPVHRRDPAHVAKVRLAPQAEHAFFDSIGRPSPSAKRAEWNALFREAASWKVPERYRDSWTRFCTVRAASALHWRKMKPFDREAISAGRELLALLPRLLAWEGRHFVRWASSVVCGDSKMLERRQRTLEVLLAEATDNAVPTLESLGMLPVPSGVTFHGPLQLRIGTEWRDFRDLHGPTTLSGSDVERITGCRCEARRCLTVENATPFRSLAALRSGELLIHTSYPNDATLRLLAQLRSLDPSPEFWHFGDTDPSGFHILADLRRRSGIPVKAFQMRFRPDNHAPALNDRERALTESLLAQMPEERAALAAILSAGNKGAFEQESLKPPANPQWPFYALGE